MLAKTLEHHERGCARWYMCWVMFLMVLSQSVQAMVHVLGVGIQAGTESGDDVWARSEIHTEVVLLQRPLLLHRSARLRQHVQHALQRDLDLNIVLMVWGLGTSSLLYRVMTHVTQAGVSDGTFPRLVAARRSRSLPACCHTPRLPSPCSSTLNPKP